MYNNNKYNNNMLFKTIRKMAILRTARGSEGNSDIFWPFAKARNQYQYLLVNI